MVDLSESVLVIGYGNPQRGDDGVAWKVLDALRAAQPRPEAPPLRLKRVHQLAPELAEPASRARASSSSTPAPTPPAGTVSCEPVTPGAGTASLTHSLSPQAVLLYAERLFGHVPRAAVVTIGGAAFDHGERAVARGPPGRPEGRPAHPQPRPPLGPPAPPRARRRLSPGRRDGPRRASP